MSDWPCGMSGHILSRSAPSSSRFHRAPARVHPVDVAAHRVDLAVVGDEAVRVRQLPGREGVGREALVHQRQRRHGQRVAQVVVEAADLAARAAGPCRRPCASRTTACRAARRPGRLVLLRELGAAGSGSACGSPGACARTRPGPATLGPRPTIAWRITGIVSMHRLAEARRVGRHVAPAEQRLALDAR